MIPIRAGGAIRISAWREDRMLMVLIGNDYADIIGDPTRPGGANEVRQFFKTAATCVEARVLRFATAYVHAALRLRAPAL
jgi:hypothetical protein